MCSNSSTFLPIIVLLVLFSLFFFFSISKSSASLHTILIALLSTIFLITLTTKKGSPDENLVQDNLQEWQLQPSLGDVTNTEVTKESETQSHSSLPSDSKSSSGSIMGECFEIDHSGNQNLCISDRLASDNEDSLIEIKLPSSHFSGLTEDEEPKQKLESIFKQQDLLELLAEINEDENLIEIDISMGSTKCQDLRLKQELPYFGDQCVPSD